MTKISFGCTKMEIFYQEKAFHAGKKSGKMTLPPQKNSPVTPLLFWVDHNKCVLHGKYAAIFRIFTKVKVLNKIVYFWHLPAAILRRNKKSSCKLYSK